LDLGIHTRLIGLALYSEGNLICIFSHSTNSTRKGSSSFLDTKCSKSTPDVLDPLDFDNLSTAAILKNKEFTKRT